MEKIALASDKCKRVLYTMQKKTQNFTVTFLGVLRKLENDR